ncbi:MAG TPA: BsuBI/PstI family type II restriction endonuclease [Pirellulales bacterium]|jgi:hypothetical protein|nr:BsuBI/PstI family type II restriction endonuclease [Pirellulales bacterium]
MSKRDEALEILKSLGLPRQQQNERSCLTLFEQARLIDRNPDDPTRPTNSGDTVYQLTESAAEVLRSFGTPGFSTKCEHFIERHGTLSAAYDRARNLHKVPVTLPDGSTVELSPGVHNELQRLIVEDFAARFAAGSTVLYLGDTAEKRLVVATDELNKLNIPAMNHDKLPDVVLFDEHRNWLFLIEAVTTHGPVSPKRHSELEAMLRKCPAGRVYVTAFMDFTAFKKYASEIVWESEVWVAEFPDHMIHFNGGKFLGPYPPLEDDDNGEQNG